MTSTHQVHERRKHEERIRITFDEWVRAGKADGMERRHKRLAELMLERIDVKPDARVLDIGCGDGWTGKMLSKRLPRGAFVGIDVSDEMVLRARSRYRDFDNVLFARAAAEEIPWAEDYFTHILSIESAYYWKEVSCAAKEMYRVAAYGGTFHILINYYSENPFSEGWDRETGLHLLRLGAQEWAKQFRECGFESVSTDRIPDDSPITPGKAPAELARREGLQRVGALYVTGSKPALLQSATDLPDQHRNPFRVLR